MSVISWFGGQDLGAKYAMVLGVLVIFTVVFATSKLLYTRHKINKLVKQGEISRSEAKQELHILNQKDEEEGDLFGVRALERGFFGGVTQSRPSTPVSMAPTLVQPKSVYDPSRPNSRNGSLKAGQPITNNGLGVHGPGRHSPPNLHSMILPASPTFPQRQESLYSHSPSGSVASMTEPHALSASGQTRPNTPNSIRVPTGPMVPRPQTHLRNNSNQEYTLVPHHHANGSTSSFNGRQPQVLYHQPNGSTSSFNGRQYMAWNMQNAQSSPSSPAIPRVVVNGNEVDADSHNNNQRRRS